MTTDEAKTKICPFMNEYIRVGEREIAEVKNCICDECMAWEWETTYKHYDTLPPKPIGKSTTDGYCKRIGK